MLPLNWNCKLSVKYKQYNFFVEFVLIFVITSTTSIELLSKGSKCKFSYLKTILCEKYCKLDLITTFNISYTKFSSIVQIKIAICILSHADNVFFP